MIRATSYNSLQVITNTAVSQVYRKQLFYVLHTYILVISKITDVTI
jgi:hypothetical protein